LAKKKKVKIAVLKIARIKLVRGISFAKLFAYYGDYVARLSGIAQFEHIFNPP